MAKTSKEYNNELCAILSESRIKKFELFEKIFEILEEDSKRPDEELWDDVCKGFCVNNQSTRPLELLSKYFYKKSHLLFTSNPPERYYYDENVPSIVLLELLFYVIEELKKKEYNKDFLEDFITTINRSDNSGILSIGISDLDYFYTVTTENKERLQKSISAIVDEFKKIEQPHEGNYSLAHVIQSYCNGLIRREEGPVLSDSQRADLTPTKLRRDEPENDWKTYIRVATPAENEQYKRNSSHTLTPARASYILSNPSLLRRDLPVCMYGSACIRRTITQEGRKHFATYSHPPGFIPINEPKKQGGGKSRNISKNSSRRTHTRRRISTKRRRTTRRHRR